MITVITIELYVGKANEAMRNVLLSLLREIPSLECHFIQPTAYNDFFFGPLRHIRVNNEFYLYS